MELENKCLRLGVGAVLFALLVRLVSGGLPGKVLSWITSPEVGAAILSLETGRRVPVPEATAPTEKPVSVAETTAATEPEVPALQPAVFSPEDAQAVEVLNVCNYPVDTQALLLQPLTWELAGDVPTVLILHAHGSECYADAENGEFYRSLAEEENMVSVGAYLGALLEAGGIRVLHDRTLHDQPSYNDAYVNARQSARAYLEEYPSIALVLDLHRDAAQDPAGNQLPKTVTLESGETAQLMLVVGTDAGGLNHPQWQENMALAVKLYAQLEKQAAGLCRPISFRTQRFNQDLSPGALLVEVGAAGNTLEQAMRGAEQLAQGILALSRGTETAATIGSTS